MVSIGDEPMKPHTAEHEFDDEAISFWKGGRPPKIDSGSAAACRHPCVSEINQVIP